jgi:DNA-binding transcriptional LysR family regulator
MNLKMNWPADLQLSQLQLFVRLADAGSLSAAARQLQITPAAASAALKRLELALSVRLVERSTRSMRLTPEGELLRDHAQRALGVLDDARALLGSRTEQLVGEIHVAAPSDLGREVLNPMLDGFLARHPRVQLAWHLSDGVHDLLRDQVDVAVRYGELPDSGLVARRLHTTPRTLVASPDYVARHGAPREPAELAEHNCLVLNLAGRPLQQWTFEREGRRVGVKVKGNRRADDGALVRQWALQGLGIAQKARLDVLADLRSGRLVALMPEWQGMPFPLHAIVPAQRHLPLRVRRLLEELTLRFGDLAAQDVPVDGHGGAPTAEAPGR